MMTAAENTDIYIQEMFYSTTFIQHQRLLVTLQMILNNDVVMFSNNRINQLLITYTMLNSDLHSCLKVI